jgi:hypothetical protein
LDAGQFLFYVFIFVVQIGFIAIFVGQKLIDFIVSFVDQLPIDSRRVSKNVFSATERLSRFN